MRFENNRKILKSVDHGNNYAPMVLTITRKGGKHTVIVNGQKVKGKAFHSFADALKQQRYDDAIAANPEFQQPAQPGVDHQQVNGSAQSP